MYVCIYLSEWYAKMYLIVSMKLREQMKWKVKKIINEKLSRCIFFSNQFWHNVAKMQKMQK